MKAKILIPTILALILVLSVSFYCYISYHPYIRLGISEGDGLDIMLYSMSDSDIISVAKEIEENMIEIADWNNEVVTFLQSNANHPRDIKPSAEIIDGKTILRYEGYYTTEDGEKVDYFEEKTFDFVVIPDDDLLK